MSAITLEVPDSLAGRLQSRRSQWPEILERGIRQVEAVGQPGYVDVTEVLELLARLPDPAEILSLNAAPSLQARVEALIERQREAAATDEELRELEHYLYVDRLVRVAKAHAQKRLAAG